MTVLSTDRTAGPFTLSGSGGPFPFTLYVFEAADLDVNHTSTDGVVTPLVLASDYTVALNSDQSANPGGELTLLSTATYSTGTLDVTSRVQATQGLQITNAGGFYPRVIELALDKLTVLLQQQDVTGRQTLRVPFPETLSQLPIAASRANKQLLFGPDGDLMLAAPVSGSAADVLLQMAASSGSSLIGFIQSLTGSVARTLQAKVRELWVSPEDLGAVGDGVVDDGLAVERALASGRCIFSGTYNIGTRAISTTSSVTVLWMPGAKVIGSSAGAGAQVNLRPTDATKRVEMIGTAWVENLTLRIGGTADAAWTDPQNPSDSAVTVKTDDIRVVGYGANTTPACQILYTRRTLIGNLYGELTGATGQRCFYLVAVMNGTIGSIEARGYTMGVEIDQPSPSTQPSYSAVRVTFGFMRVYKDNGVTPDVSGWHGVYAHGCKQCTFAGFTGEGWGASVTTSGTLKWRDNDSCTVVGAVTPDTLRMTSDDNYSGSGGFTILNRYNRWQGGINCPDISLVVSGTGYHLDNRIEGLICSDLSADGNGGNQGGHIIVGVSDIDGPAGVINGTGLTFDGGDLTVGSTTVFTGPALNMQGGVIVRGTLRYQPAAASTMNMHAYVQGDILHAATATTAAHTANLRGSCTGQWSMDNTGSGVRTGNLRNFVSDGAEPSTSFQPDVKTYRASNLGGTAYP